MVWLNPGFLLLSYSIPHRKSMMKGSEEGGKSTKEPTASLFFQMRAPL